MKKEKEYEDVEIQIRTFNGYPIMETITAEEQSEANKDGNEAPRRK